MVSTSELRDRLMEQRTLYQQSVARSKEAQEKISTIFNSFTDEQKITIKTATGVSLEDLQTLDLERMKTDADYLKQSKDVLDDAILRIHSYLEEALDV